MVSYLLCHFRCWLQAVCCRDYLLCVLLIVISRHNSFNILDRAASSVLPTELSTGSSVYCSAQQWHLRSKSADRISTLSLPQDEGGGTGYFSQLLLAVRAITVASVVCCELIVLNVTQLL